MQKQPFDLVGIDGNAFSIMAYVKKAMQKGGYNAEQIQHYLNDAMSGDYDNLLFKSQEMIEQVNAKLGF